VPSARNASSGESPTCRHCAAKPIAGSKPVTKSKEALTGNSPPTTPAQNSRIYTHIFKCEQTLGPCDGHDVLRIQLLMNATSKFILELEELKGNRAITALTIRTPEDASNEYACDVSGELQLALSGLVLETQPKSPVFSNDSGQVSNACS
jgi:hypothetical protein